MENTIDDIVLENSFAEHAIWRARWCAVKQGRMDPAHYIVYTRNQKEIKAGPIGGERTKLPLLPSSSLYHARSHAYLSQQVRGRRSFYSRLSKEASIVQYDESGDVFFMAVDEKVAVRESECATLILELENKKRVLCVASGRNGILFTGGEDRSLTAWDTASGKVAYSVEDAHGARIKGIVVLSKVGDDSGDENPYLVASASSDGVIGVWDVRMAYKEKPNPLTETNTRSRITCLAGSSIRPSKQSHAEMMKADENPEVAALES